MDFATSSDHRLAAVRPADEDGTSGGRRPVARCSCGWRSRAVLTARFARAEWEQHTHDA